jgi:hypothetical protein
MSEHDLWHSDEPPTARDERGRVWDGDQVTCGVDVTAIACQARGVRRSEPRTLIVGTANCEPPLRGRRR